MSYQDVLRILGARRRFGVRPGLAPMQEALGRIGNPEQRAPACTLHIAGTNGKGSVAATASALLGRAGLRVGLYTSPHLCRLAERFVIDGEAVTEAELEPRLARAMAEEPELTFFEICTLVAFELFADRGCDGWVIEVGLGGRLDATNALGRVGASVITSIGLDHQAILGDDLTAIAREKAGILRPHVPAFVGALPPEALVVVKAQAAAVGAPLRQVIPAASGGVVRGRDAQPLDAELALPGAHQLQNASLALAAVDELLSPPLPDAAVRQALAGVRWPGRGEWLRPDLLVDGAHNLDGAQVLDRLLATLATPPCVLVFGASADKPVEAMLAVLAPRFAHVVMTRARSERAIDPVALCRLRPGSHCAASADAALALAVSLAQGGTVVVAGSLFVVGEVRSCVLGLPIDPAWASDPPAVKS